MRETLAAYALDAIDGETRGEAERELLEHLPGCAECAEAFLSYREVAADLAVSVDPVTPSRALEERLLDEVRGARNGPVPAAASNRRPRFAARLAVVAAVVALGASAALNVVLVRRASGAGNDRIAMAALIQAASDPDSTSVALRGHAGSVSLVYPRTGSAVLIASSLPAAPSGHVYELWFLDDGAVPIATFVPRRGRVVLPLPQSPRSYRGAAITVERTFVDKPTTDPIYTATLNA